MAWCLTAPSHYLNQCWLIINRVQWHSSEGNFIRDTSAINCWNQLDNYLSKIPLKSPKGQWAPSHYLNQCWPMTSELLWQFHRKYFRYLSLKWVWNFFNNLRLANLPGANELNTEVETSQWKDESSHDANFIIGGTRVCCYDSLSGHQWWQSCHHSNSVLLMTWLPICWWHFQMHIL